MILLSKNSKILVITSNTRQKFIAEHLKKLNIIIHESDEYVKGDFDSVILPMAYSKNKEIIRSFDGKLIIGGRFNKEDIILASKLNINLYDYFDNEYVKYENAYITAEAAIALAINNTNKSLRNSKCLITGFGRIGKMLAKLLSVFCNDITVSARKDCDLAQINAFGYRCINTNNISDINDFDLIFNTIPQIVLDKNILNTHKKNVLIIDLASKPGGMDFDYAKENDINYIHALSLPSKISPETDAEILSKSIIKILSEGANYGSFKI